MAGWSTIYASLHHVIETRHACGAELSRLDFETLNIHSTMEAGQKPTSNELDVDIWSTGENLAPITPELLSQHRPPPCDRGPSSCVRNLRYIISPQKCVSILLGGKHCLYSYMDTGRERLTEGE